MRLCVRVHLVVSVNMTLMNNHSRWMGQSHAKQSKKQIKRKSIHDWMPHRPASRERLLAQQNLNKSRKKTERNEEKNARTKKIGENKYTNEERRRETKSKLNDVQRSPKTSSDRTKRAQPASDGQDGIPFVSHLSILFSILLLLLFAFRFLHVCRVHSHSCRRNAWYKIWNYVTFAAETKLPISAKVTGFRPHRRRCWNAALPLNSII